MAEADSAVIEVHCPHCNRVILVVVQVELNGDTISLRTEPVGTHSCTEGGKNEDGKAI